VTRAIFFDAGHTLLFAHPDLGTVYAETTSRFGVHLEPSRFVEAFIPVYKESAKRYAEAGESSDAHDYAMWMDITGQIHARLPALASVEFAPWFEALYRRFGDPDVWRMYDDVRPALERLRARRLRLGIVSNWDSRLRRICEGLGLDRQVDFLVISAEAGVRKPDPRIFGRALAAAGVGPDEAIHVGDLLEEDVEGARRAGIRGILIEREKRITSGPARAGVTVIRSLLELFELL
jgi:putative hydrolase of the HAD superfamily